MHDDLEPAIEPDGATELTFEQLLLWVVWQFPRPVGEALCGAVHPPQPEHGWFPAAIFPEELRVQVFGANVFGSPEEAADWVKEHFPR